MSNDDYLRQQTQDQLQHSPSSEKVSESQVPNHHDRQVINNEVERIRREQDRK